MRQLREKRARLEEIAKKFCEANEDQSGLSKAKIDEIVGKSDI